MTKVLVSLLIFAIVCHGKEINVNDGCTQGNEYFTLVCELQSIAGNYFDNTNYQCYPCAQPPNAPAGLFLNLCYVCITTSQVLTEILV